MPQYDYLTNPVKTTGGNVQVPQLYFDNASTARPPYTFTGNVNLSIRTSYASLHVANTSSPFFIRHNGQTLGTWATIVSNADGQIHEVVRLYSGKYISARYPAQGYSDPRMIDIFFYNADDTLIAEAPSAYIASDIPELCFTVLEDTNGNPYFAVEYVITFSSVESGWYLRNIGNTTGFVTSEDVGENYTWQPFVQLVGNNGQFRMNLSQIKAGYIGDGEITQTTQDNDRFIIEPNSSLRRISGNFALDEERIIAWCGDNYATLTKHMTDDVLAIRIKLYFDPSLPAIYDTGYMYLYDPLDDYYFSFIYDIPHQAARIDLIHYYESNGSYWWSYNEGLLPSPEDLLDIYVWLDHNGEVSDKPYDTGTTDDGGDTGLPRPQDHIYTPTLPTKSGLGLGLIGLYHPTAEQLGDIADLLWSNTLIDNVLKYFSNFADNILALYVLPFLPANLPQKHFTVGHYATDIDNVDYVTTRFYDIDMGSVELGTLWDSYLDYEPYSRCQIYLPYIGMKDLDMDELMCPTDINGMLPKASGCTLSLLYRLDILTGSIVAQLKISNEYLTDEVRYQFSGKVGYSIPLTGETYNGIISSILNVATAGASALLSGGLTAPLVDGAAIAGTVQAQKGSVTHSGNLSGDVSMMGQKTPYIEISSPNKPYLDLQENFTGFPSYKSDQLDNFSGFTQVVEVHAEGFVCTESERTEIIRLLKEGVIL